MKVRNWFDYWQILKPEEICKGSVRIGIYYPGKYHPNKLLKIREKFKSYRYNFTIEKVHWLEGTKILLSTGSSMYEAIKRKEGFDFYEFSLLKQTLKKGDVFIDIGANIGFYTIFAAKIVGDMGKVIAFEPSERELTLLNKNIKLNGFTHVVTYKLALSNFCGKAIFYVSGGNATDVSTLSSTFYNKKITLEKAEEVEVTTLDNIIMKTPLNKISFIKIDAEGHDIFILEGAKNILKQYKPVILVEVSPPSLKNTNCSVRQLYEVLKLLNYNVYFFDKNRKLTQKPPPYTTEPDNSYFNIVCYPSKK